MKSSLDYVSVTLPHEGWLHKVNDAKPRVFLAGGISGCPPWQDVAILQLQKEITDLRVNIDTPMCLINPRNPNYQDGEEEAIKQIKWERDRLEGSHIILFWFPEETLCPITLLELGKYMKTTKLLVVGTHPNYKRRIYVREQLKHERPEIIVHDSLERAVQELLAKILQYQHSYHPQR